MIVILGQEAPEPAANLRMEDVPESCYKENEDGVTLLAPLTPAGDLA